MSDYGDEYSDYGGDDWFYVEDEYMAADDLAEHAVASPPPTTYGDEDMQPEWDRFDYFNDIEYASDGYDDATFQTHNAKDSKIGQKRKRGSARVRSKKRQRTAQHYEEKTDASIPAHSPIVWRSQLQREPQPRIFQDTAPSYALLENWREKLADTPDWARGSPPAKALQAEVEDDAELDEAPPTELASPTADARDDHDDDELEEDDDNDAEEGLNISQEALMAALQRQLAAAGGPLSNMDPQQLLQFAMRMVTDKDAGDDIAGEMADAMLQGEGEDDGEDGDDSADTEENLKSWVAQQRSRNNASSATAPESPNAIRNGNRPPTPPLSEASRSIHTTKDSNQSEASRSKAWTVKESRSAPTLKRKADQDDDEAEGSQTTTKKRATRSFDAPTAASQARAAPARSTRSAKAKR